jgi:hypothetical protein
MDPVQNPFNPGAGHQPPALTGRDGQLKEFSTACGRLEAGRGVQSFFLIGLRGVGKTVLLKVFQQKANERDWKTAFKEIKDNTSLTKTLADMSKSVLEAMSTTRRVKKRLRRALGALRGFTLTFPDGSAVNLNFAALPGVADSGDLSSDLGDLLVEVGEAAREQHTCVAFFLDEIQFAKEAELSALIAALHRVSQDNVPLIVIGAGLPQFPGKAGNALPYAERLLRFPRIGALDRTASDKALLDPAKEAGIAFEDDALELIFERSEGYPYFVQEYGLQAWNVATQSPITFSDVVKAEAAVREELDQSFFNVRIGRASNNERRYMRAMAELGPGEHRSGAVAKLLGQKTSQVSLFRDNLIKKGLVHDSRYGYVAFTVPQFDDYMRRHHPFHAAQQIPPAPKNAGKP